MHTDRAGVEAFYRRYLHRCNEHRFHDLGDFVADDVEVNGAPTGLPNYGEGLAGVVQLFPDFHWELQHLLVDGNWLSAHLIDTGTRVGGQRIRLPEFALYRIDAGRIAAVWGDLDRDRMATA